jgi:branched-chain amino acid aminotransferase
MESKYYLHNGKFYLSDEKSLSHKNRAFRYGDALFETIHCLGTVPQFIDNHWDRLSEGMKLLKMEPDSDLTLHSLNSYIGKLLNRNRIYKGARIRLTVFRDDGGLYAPERNTISWVMEASSLEYERYELNTKGLHIDIFDGVHKPVNILSALKTTNSMLFVLAGIYRVENGLDECLILNQYGRVAESISSNIFLLLDNKLITPPLSEGCLAGTMRHTVIDLIKKLGYTVEEKGILERNLIESEEIFLTNAIQGVQWVGAYKDRRYFNFFSRKLIVLLNEFAFQND